MKILSTILQNIDTDLEKNGHDRDRVTSPIFQNIQEINLIFSTVKTKINFYFYNPSAVSSRMINYELKQHHQFRDMAEISLSDD